MYYVKFNLMGIKNLNNLIQTLTGEGVQKIHLSKFKNKTFAIDTNLYIYKFLYAGGNHINGLFFMVNKLSKFNITPIFVFDGKPPTEKKNTLNSRKKVKFKIENEILVLKSSLDITENKEKREKIQEKIKNLQKKLVYVDKNVINLTKSFLDLMGVSYLHADGEAEQLCAKLSRLDIVDGVISDDTDSIACGSKITLREFTNKNDYVLCYNLKEVLYKLDLNYDSFLDMCLLLGTDYNGKLKGKSFKDIYLIILEYKSIENLIEKGVSIYFDYKKIRNIYNLVEIKPNIIELANQNAKRTNIEDARVFIKEHSTINKKTYDFRLKKIFGNKKTLKKVHSREKLCMDLSDY